MLDCPCNFPIFNFESERLLIVDTIAMSFCVILLRFNLSVFSVPYTKVTMEQIYLEKNAGGGHIRRRTQDGASVYYITQKRKTDKVETREEQEIKITKTGHESLTKFADLKYRTINKDRIYFVWKNQYFELDLLKSPKDITNLMLLEIKLHHKDQEWEIPEWLGYYVDVTGIKEYSNKNLARYNAVRT